jgi:exonuclease III
VCIYRSPDGQFKKFLDKLELVIKTLLRKNKNLILCGDWNIDFLHENDNQKDLTDLLLRYNLVNTVRSPYQNNEQHKHIDRCNYNEQKVLYGTCNGYRIRSFKPSSTSVVCAT